MACRAGLSGVMIAGLIVSGCSTTAQTAKPPAGAAATVLHDSTCLSDTGSRLPVNGTKCRGTGRSYTNDDLMRTGATSVGDALQLLDPTITVNR